MIANITDSFKTSCFKPPNHLRNQIVFQYYLFDGIKPHLALHPPFALCCRTSEALKIYPGSFTKSLQGLILPVVIHVTRFVPLQLHWQSLFIKIHGAEFGVGQSLFGIYSPLPLSDIPGRSNVPTVVAGGRQQAGGAGGGGGDEPVLGISYWLLVNLHLHRPEIKRTIFCYRHQLVMAEIWFARSLALPRMPPETRW